MPTLYVENVPDDLYEALRTRAQANRKSISAEVLTLLAENVPTQEELARRKKLLETARRLSSHKPAHRKSFPTSEQMQREDRRR